MDCRFIEKLEKNCSDYPETVAFISVDGGKDMCYGELWEESGRVYRYLKENRIGAESTVMITLARGTDPIIAMIGIWRAGAAVVMLDACYPPQRTEYIYKDAGCVLNINREVFDRIMKHDTLGHYEETLPHNLAYIVYTSGTTGNPKGVMQEYGTIDMCIKVHYWGDKPAREGRAAVLPPLYFGFCFINIPPMLYNLQSMALIPISIVKDPDQMVSCIEENNLTAVMGVPSLLKRMKRIPSTLKHITIGGEAARHIYSDRVEISNGYGCSESCFKVCTFRIDRDYDLTPVGRKEDLKTDICIMDEKGNILQDGEYGYLCYKAPYFRGYVGLPELTEKVHIGEYVNSGDYAVIKPDGKIYVIGRADDMIKVRGFRIEPGEVESVFQNILQVSWVGVRGITDQKNRDYLCAYYTGQPKISIEEAKTVARNMLPSYMIPSFFMKVDSIPLSVNGKISKKDLPIPEDLIKKEDN